MITTIALGIVLGGLILALLPYIMVIGFYIVIAPFLLIGWVWDKLTK